MTSTESVSESELEEALRTDPDFGIEFLDAYFQDRVIRYIKHQTWGRLQPDEIGS